MTDHRTPAEVAAQHMVGALCLGCGKGSNKKLGKVAQRDLGSANKWHARCYRERNKEA